jgi:hypothetical protein
MTRVQLRVRLNRDAHSADEKKRVQAIQILKFMGEKGSLMALKGETGPAQDLARQAFFELMNPKVGGEALPEAKGTTVGGGGGVNAAGGVNVVPPRN